MCSLVSDAVINKQRAEIGLPPNNFINSIISFNIGVELGQTAVILLANYLLVNWIKKEEWYRGKFVVPVSACIAVFALWLAFERAISI